MPRLAHIIAVLTATGGLALAQGAQAQGMEIYERDCALCHMEDGTGNPPTFPALAGNDMLGNLDHVVENIHAGRGNMPPFPSLSASEIADVVTYIRGSWGNELAAVEAEEVATILDGLGATVETVTIWDSVYTAEQAERGADAYLGPCGLCHGRRLNGAPDDPDMRPAPALARYRFIRNWDGRSLATLFEYTRSTMPQSNPGYMDDQTYVDIIAHMLAMSGAPAGDTELTPDRDALGQIVIGPEPEEQ